MACKTCGHEAERHDTLPRGCNAVRPVGEKGCRCPKSFYDVLDEEPKDYLDVLRKEEKESADVPGLVHVVLNHYDYDLSVERGRPMFTFVCSWGLEVVGLENFSSSPILTAEVERILREHGLSVIPGPRP